jgi:hypothetical protein
MKNSIPQIFGHGAWGMGHGAWGMGKMSLIPNALCDRAIKDLQVKNIRHKTVDH